MNSYLNIRTLSLLTGIVSLVLAGILLYASSQSKTYRGFKCWTRAFLLNSFGIIAIFFQGSLPQAVTISAANFAMVSYLILIHVGFRRFFNLDSRKWLPVYVSSILIHTLWYAYFTYVTPNLTARVIMGFLCYAFYSVDCMRQVIKYSKRVVPQRQWLFVGMFGSVALWLVTVTIFAFVSREQVQHFADTGLLFGITLIINIVGNILGAFGMILINNQRLYLEFIRSDKQVEQLSGLLPICAKCKKIRDDSGYWENLERYLADHTALHISHSICPDCMADLYPDLEFKENASTDL